MEFLKELLDGPRSGLKTGLYGGLAVGALHALKDAFPTGMVRRVLISWDLLDPIPEDTPQGNVLCRSLL